MGQWYSRSAEDGVGTGIQKLDNKLLEMVLSFTTPTDACRVALVSAKFRSAADSDSVWERFLPRDYMDIINSAVDPAPLWNLKKKELYFRLCDPMLINKGSMTFSLDRVSGKKSCMLAAWTDIDITWVGTKQYWIKVQRSDSRFAKAVELVSICWLEITTWLDCNLVPLSLHTTYIAYLVFKLTCNTYGLHSQYAVIYHGDKIWTNKKVSLEAIWSEFGGDDNDDKDEEEFGTEQKLRRSDGWAEVEIGEFFYDGVGDGQDPFVVIRLHQTLELHWKSGLIIEGLELRPKL